MPFKLAEQVLQSKGLTLAHLETIGFSTCERQPDYQCQPDLLRLVTSLPSVRSLKTGLCLAPLWSMFRPAATHISQLDVRYLSDFIDHIGTMQQLCPNVEHLTLHIDPISNYVSIEHQAKVLAEELPKIQL